MGYILLMLFIGVPIAEIAVLIQVGSRIGLFPTLGIILATAFLGTWMIRHQGLATLTKAQNNLDHGEFPLREVFDGLCLLVAGALLLTPGFITDGLGFFLLIPPARNIIRKYSVGYLIARGTIHMSKTDGFDGRGNTGGGVIDGEFEDVTGEPDQTGVNPPSLNHDGASGNREPVVPPKE